MDDLISLLLREPQKFATTDLPCALRAFHKSLLDEDVVAEFTAKAEWELPDAA